MQVNKKDVKRAFTLAISICFINFSCCCMQNLTYAQTEATNVSEEVRKREILKKYPLIYLKCKKSDLELKQLVMMAN